MSPVTPIPNIVIGIFETTERSRQAVEELRAAGFPQDSISFVIRSQASKETNSSVVKDAEIGAAVGGVGGVLLSLAAVGPVVMAGPILGALGGAGLGAVAGGLVGALTKIGGPEPTAGKHAESARRGDAIVTVRVEDAEQEERAASIMERLGAVDRGYQGHDPGREPLSEDELRREREWRHGETRDAHDIAESLADSSHPIP